jgi:hypothetical protein
VQDDKENEGGPSHRLPEESQASSLPSMLSGGHGPGPYGSGNGASHRGGEGKDEGRESDEASTGGSKGLPPIRNSYTLATLPTKSGKGAHYNAGQSRVSAMHTGGATAVVTQACPPTALSLTQTESEHEFRVRVREIERQREESRRSTMRQHGTLHGRQVTDLPVHYCSA